MASMASASSLPSAESMSPLRISAADLETFVVEVLMRVGVGKADAATTATVLVTTDTWGTFTHGVKALRGYVRRLNGGGLNPKGIPTIVRQGPAWAIIDAQSSLGMVGSVVGMNTAIAKAKAAGIGYVGLNNSCHFGAAGYYAVMAAQQGLVGLAMANDAPSMTVPGARGRVMGNNPFAFAAPAEDGKPIFIDMALSTVAGGKVMAAKALGKSIPNNWAVDSHGVPTTDPADFLEHGGSLQPMAGHKGYGLALMVETLAGLLTGAAIRSEVLSWIAHDPSKPTGHGAAFLAIDVAGMIDPREFQTRVIDMVKDLRSSPRAKGSDRIYLPGEMEWDNRDKALSEGIVLPPDVVACVVDVAKDTGVEVPGSR